LLDRKWVGKEMEGIIDSGEKLKGKKEISMGENRLKSKLTLAGEGCRKSAVGSVGGVGMEKGGFRPGHPELPV